MHRRSVTADTSLAPLALGRSHLRSGMHPIPMSAHGKASPMKDDVKKKKGKETDTFSDISNAGADDIALSEPYTARVTIVGTAKLLFHAWNNEAVQVKGDAPKGSKAKKTDNVESYVYRDEKRNICLPGEYLRQSICHAAKFRQDPRSPRKSAMDLFKAAIVPMTELASLGSKDWEFLDRRRVLIQRNAITRERPGFYHGWKATIDLMVLTPEYVSMDILSDVITNAGRLVGVGDFRPTFGRFRVERLEKL